MGHEMNSDNDKGLEALNVWKEALQLAVDVCKRVIPSFPTQEKYALAAQMRRSVQSIPANIAEGYGRYYYQEGVHYCYIARGSLEETKTQIILAHELGYLSDLDYQGLLQHIEIIRRQLNGYITYLKNSKRGTNDPGYRIREDLPGHETYVDDVIDSPSLIDPSPIDPSPVD
jgi:four helix bundle protein